MPISLMDEPMKRYISTGLFTLILLYAGTVNADTPEQCERYRAQIIELKAVLDQTYAQNRSVLRDSKADPAERDALIKRYINDPNNLKLRELLDRFRADRRDQCGWWRKTDGALN